MKNYQINLPKVSKILGASFFILAFLIIGYFTISGSIYCSSIQNAGMCGFEIMIINLPMINFYKLYMFLIPEVPQFVDLTILVLATSIFWSFIGVLIGLVISFLKFLYKKIIHRVK